MSKQKLCTRQSSTLTSYRYRLTTYLLTHSPPLVVHCRVLSTTLSIRRTVLADGLLSTLKPGKKQHTPDIRRSSLGGPVFLPADHHPLITIINRQPTFDRVIPSRKTIDQLVRTCCQSHTCTTPVHHQSHLDDLSSSLTAEHIVRVPRSQPKKTTNHHNLSSYR